MVVVWLQTRWLKESVMFLHWSAGASFYIMDTISQCISLYPKTGFDLTTSWNQISNFFGGARFADNTADFMALFFHNGSAE
jgi:hypothetical protein